MEDKQKNEQKPEFEGNLGFIWLIGILVILLGCVTVYTLKITVENKELKQAQQKTPVVTEKQTQEQPIVENKTNNESVNNEKESSNAVVIKNSFKGENVTISTNISIGDDEEGYSFSYAISGKKEGKILITREGKLLKELTMNKKVVTISSFENYTDGAVYVLYEDGSVDKMKYSDVKKKKYEFKNVSKAKDIIRFEKIQWQYPTEPVGGEHSIVAVDKNGNTIELDSLIS